MNTRDLGLFLFGVVAGQSLMLQVLIFAGRLA